MNSKYKVRGYIDENSIHLDTANNNSEKLAIRLSSAISYLSEGGDYDNLNKKLKPFIIKIIEEHSDDLSKTMRHLDYIIYNEEYNTRSGPDQALSYLREAYSRTDIDGKALTIILILEQMEICISKFKQHCIKEYKTEYEEEYDYEEKHNPSFKISSKGEKMCLESLNVIFPSRKFIKIRHPDIINPLTGRCLELDLYNNELKIAIEYNGKQHYEYVPYFHRSIEEFEAQKQRDIEKVIQCEENGIRLIVVPYKYKTKNEITEYIRNNLELNFVD